MSFCWGLVGSFLFALTAAAPLLFQAGFLNTRGGGDSPFLLFRLHELSYALSQGVFPVRWMPNGAFGLGYPFFNYYASLPFYFAAGFRGLGFSYVLSLKLTHLAGFLVAAWGMYAWVRHTTGRRGVALLASAAYTFAPYHLVNVYVRGDSLVEFWAMAWYPWVLLALYQAARQPSARRIAWVGLAFGALVMTHNVSALIFAPFVAVYAIGSGLTRPAEGAPSKSPLQRLVYLVLAGVLGLALAAWVWVPALGEQDYVQLGDQTTGYFSYENHFRSDDLVQGGFFFDYDTGSDNTTPFSMGLGQAVLIGLGVIALVIRMVRERAWWRDGFLLFGLALSTWMITPASRLLWEHVPLLPFTQFPWRFLSLQACFGAAISGAVVTILTPRFQHTAANELRGSIKTQREPAVVDKVSSPSLLVRLLPAAGLGIILAVTMLGALNPNFIPLTDADVTPERLGWYESFSGNIGTTIRYEYLPTWARPRPYTSDMLLGREPRAKFLEGEGTAERIEAGANQQVWAFEVESESARVAIPLLYWPGWKARIIEGQDSGQQIDIAPLDGLGYIQMTVPQGDYTIRLRLGRTPLRLGAEIVSLVGLAITLILWRPRLPRLDWMGWTLVAGAILSVVVLAMILHSLPDKELDGPINADFGQEAYFHHSPDWQYDGESSLIGVPLPQAVQGGPVLTADLDHYLPGLYFPIYQGEGRFTASGEPRDTIYLSPVILDDAVEDQPTRQDDFGFATLIDLRTGSEVEVLFVSPWWEAAREAVTNYAIAFRLVDEAGNEWAALDTQAGGAGLYPTGLWQPGEIVPDSYRLELREGTPPGSYTLQVTLYDVTTLEPVGSTHVDGVEYDKVSQYCLAAADRHELVDGLSIEAVNFPASLPEGEALTIEVGWLAGRQPDQDYQVEWVLRAEDETAAYTQITALAPESDPRTWQSENDCIAYVLGRHRFDLPDDLAPGDYTLTLQVLSEDGIPLGDSYEAGTVMLEGRVRVFDVPPLDVPLDITFGEQLKLWGYSLRRSDDTLEMDAAWGALVTPSTDYKIFIHLFNPETEEIAVQIDTMPRDYTYPTSLWAAGEVVSETFVFDLSGVPAGEYRIALGWYDPGSVRLPVHRADGQPVPDNRVVLDEPVMVP